MSQQNASDQLVRGLVQIVRLMQIAYEMGSYDEMLQQVDDCIAAHQQALSDLFTEENDFKQRYKTPKREVADE